MHVVDGVGTQQHDAGRLLEFLAVEHVDVGHPGDALAVEVLVDLGDPGMGAQLDIGTGERRRDHRDMRAALGVRLAAEALAVTAILAGAEFRAVLVGVGLRRIRRRPREGMVTKLARGIAEHLAGEYLGERRQRIFAGARRLEGVAAGLNHAAQIAGLAGNRCGVFELVVIGLELVIGDAPVLDRHVLGNEALAVALLVERAHLELHVGPPPGVTAPVHAGAADALARQERAEPAHRQRFLRGIVAHGQRVALGIHHQFLPHHVAQLVTDVGQRIVGTAGAHLAALERDDLEAGRRRAPCQDAAGPPSPTMATSTSFNFVAMSAPLAQVRNAHGSVGNGLSRYFATFSRLTAMAPGKPIILHPALLRLPP